ncbi:hypothetical protein RJ639_040093 [Escallonia herrerae]|uniref:Pentatricopeptide repeat-containing protein n=1 Tax=Escallonia herrerae TaxID=1293975 RepID=A0AA89BEF2_9ASTE|nr:hypothetical protein RJ639_040093 [Escallonia herrerae]
MWLKGLELVRKMPELNLECDNFTLSAALCACAGLSAIELGRQVHGTTEGVLWTSMLGVYGRNGNHKEVIGLFKEMVREGIRPDGVAFVTVISACGHTGQVTLGIDYFKSMARNFGLDPSPEHYSCLVALLCRAGELGEAWKLLNDMSNNGDDSHVVSTWGALLSACIHHGNIDLGKLAAQRALQLDPRNVGIFVLISNMYAKHGLWNEIGQLREVMQERGLKKDGGWSWIEATR